MLLFSVDYCFCCSLLLLLFNVVSMHLVVDDVIAPMVDNVTAGVDDGVDGDVVVDAVAGDGIVVVDVPFLLIF
jgi:hypothetical protein